MIVQEILVLLAAARQAYDLSIRAIHGPLLTRRKRH
jgi:hypothetical protein